MNVISGSITNNITSANFLGVFPGASVTGNVEFSVNIQEPNPADFRLIIKCVDINASSYYSLRIQRAANSEVYTLTILDPADVVLKTQIFKILTAGFTELFFQYSPDGFLYGILKQDIQAPPEQSQTFFKVAVADNGGKLCGFRDDIGGVNWAIVNYSEIKQTGGEDCPRETACYFGYENWGLYPNGTANPAFWDFLRGGGSTFNLNFPNSFNTANCLARMKAIAVTPTWKHHYGWVGCWMTPLPTDYTARLYVGGSSIVTDGAWGQFSYTKATNLWTWTAGLGGNTLGTTSYTQILQNIALAVCTTPTQIIAGVAQGFTFSPVLTVGATLPGGEYYGFDIPAGGNGMRVNGNYYGMPTNTAEYGAEFCFPDCTPAQSASGSAGAMLNPEMRVGRDGRLKPVVPLGKRLDKG